MNATTTAQVISPEALLQHFQGHRSLTRRVIEAFPEKDFFEFSIGGMRTPAKLVTEMLSIAAPALQAIANGDNNPYIEPKISETKQAYLERWDEATDLINDNWKKLSVEDFGEMFNLFGQYNFRVIENIFYIIDNEIHHRGQLYVYLRALGITPPFFWERER
ncbi:DinB family protein [Flavobacterium silvaticum]|uniref:Damage-inducible protein DinB n=1 Tax=Flavobacterium silvaticum TaxID=1852020 RepID=A0A972JFZ3_9FLAO|nr:DinB family protein [Flavobacterium silvaticum]NMH27671.1 damage-inducible protein DinB [Flavobacterium silvaticum]